MDKIQNQIYELVKEANPDNPLAFVHNIVKPLAKERLDDCIFSCDACGICELKQKTVTYGNPNAPIMIIGESCSEYQQGAMNVPLDDIYGDKLRDVLDELCVTNDSIFYMNSVCCFPHRYVKDEVVGRAPTVQERKECKVFLDYAIDMVRPLLIICLGAVAINAINEDIGMSNVNNIRGEYFTYRDIPVMPTYHPKFFINEDNDEELNVEYEKKFKDDITKAIKWADEEYPQLNICLPF